MFLTLKDFLNSIYIVILIAIFMLILFVHILSFNKVLQWLLFHFYSSLLSSLPAFIMKKWLPSVITIDLDERK